MIIGIDTGCKTGFAVYDRKQEKLVECVETSIHRALFKVLYYYLNEKIEKVLVEDARKRKVSKNNPNYEKRKQAVGSVKRDAKIWQDFLTDYKIPFELISPTENITKVSGDVFHKIFGVKVMSDNARDAGMLVLKEINK